MKIQELTDQIRSLIKENETEKAFELLYNNAKGNEQINQIIIQSSSFKEMEGNWMQGFISNEEHSIAKNKINRALLHITDLLEGKMTESTFKSKSAADKPTQIINTGDNSPVIQNNQGGINFNINPKP